MDRAHIPVELFVVRSQLATGRFRWQSNFTVPIGANGQYRWLRGKRGNWQAGSIEEMLAAIEAANLAISRSPGITHYKGQLNVQQCAKCGRLIGNKNHDEQECEDARSGAYRFVKGVGKIRWTERQTKVSTARDRFIARSIEALRLAADECPPELRAVLTDLIAEGESWIPKTLRRS